MRTTYVAASLLANLASAATFIPYDSYGSAKSYSDQVMLNPPTPHSQAGAIWAKTKNDLKEWTLEVQYRVNGPEHGGKGMAIWYTSDRGQGGPVYGSADKWDGLGLLLTAGSDGTGNLRGHLNDRSTAYTKLESSGGSPFALDRLLAKTDAEQNAFGSCSFAYRNLGTISTIKLSYNAQSLKVMHDDQVCFENAHISLPASYYFGVSSQSGEVADSHELFALEVTPVSHSAASTKKTEDSQPRTGGRPKFIKSEDTPAALDSAMQKVITKLIADSDKMSARIEELTHMKSTIEAIQTSLHNLEASVNSGQRPGSNSPEARNSYDDLTKQIRSMEDKFVQMERHIEKQTDHIVASLPPVAGPLKNAVYVLIFVQVIICGAYIMYRRKTEEKSKFL